MNNKHNNHKNHNNQWRFNALDTLFFRESRPMEAIGGAQLQSVFPPPARTLIGAIRRVIGEAYGVDWKEYSSKANHPLKAIMGSAESLFPLSFSGIFLLHKGTRLFPVPLVLLKGEGDQGFTRLEPSEKFTECDLGCVCLPKKKGAILGAKPLENAWVDEQGLLAFLNGGVPLNSKNIISSKDLLGSEERIGIGRDSAKGVVEKSLLYATQHVRPKADIEIGIVINGFNTSKFPNVPNFPKQGITLLGAEGRMASWHREEVTNLPTVKIKGKKGEKTRVLLMLLSHAKFQQGWLPDGFQKVTLSTQQTVWEGEIEGVKLRLISAVTGKAVREGGWDLVNGKPRQMDSFVPAGSCYFCEIQNGADASALNGKQIGQEKEYGRGEIIVGNW